jgi:hypothetical protein
VQVDPATQIIPPVQPEPPHWPNFETSSAVELVPAAVDVELTWVVVLLVFVDEVLVLEVVAITLDVVPACTTMAGTLILSMDQTLPPSDETRPV